MLPLMAEKTQLQQADEVILRYADTLSPTDISYKINGLLSASQVRSRINQLLDTPDWLTGAQQDQLVTQKMRQLIVNLEEMTLTSRTAEILIRALEALGTRLDRRAAATESDLGKLYAFQGRAFLDAITVAINSIRENTKTLPSGEVDWDAEFEPAIRYAQLELAQHEIAGQ